MARIITIYAVQVTVCKVYLALWPATSHKKKFSYYFPDETAMNAWLC